MEIKCQSEGNVSLVSLYEDAESQLSVRWSYDSFATEEEQQEYRNIYGHPINAFVDSLSKSTTNACAKKSYDSGHFSFNSDVEEEIRKYETGSSSEYEVAKTDNSKILLMRKTSSTTSFKLEPEDISLDQERDRFNRVYQYVLQQFAKQFDIYDERKLSTTRSSNSPVKNKNEYEDSADLSRNGLMGTVTCGKPINFIKNEDTLENESTISTDEELGSSSSSEYGELRDMKEERNLEVEQALKEIGWQLMQKKIG